MTKIKLSGQLSDASGSSGGATYSRNHYGLYLRNWARPLVAYTTLQLNTQAAFGAISDLWSTLSTTQMREWEVFSQSLDYKDIFGDVRKWTGQICFIRCNWNLSLVDISPILSPLPNIPFTQITKIINCTIDVTLGSYLIDFTPTPTAANVRYVVYATPGVSTGISKMFNQYRKIDVIPESQASDWSLDPAYPDYYPGQVPGQKVFIKIRPINITNGIPGVPIYNTTIII